MRRNLAISILFSVIAITILVIYLAQNLTENNGEIVMPLDDVYIHFQYARQLADGQAYIYNTGDPPTSGATSFIYPYILAIGYLIGFQGLNLGFWAILVGTVALIGSMWTIYRLCLAFDAPLWLALLTPISFALTGAVTWHTISGMETILLVCFMLWTLLAFVEKRLTLLAISATLLAIARPEGSLMTGIAVVIYGFQLWRDKSTPLSRRNMFLLLLPLLVIGIQPLTNYLITGSFSASGSQAKSLLGLIPQDWSIILSRIADNFVRLWFELLTGYSPSQNLWYLIILTVPAGLVGLLLLFRIHRAPVLLIMLWLLGVSIAISTLDTAFWHFKRYQLPLMALFVPLSVIPIVWQLKRFPKARWLVYTFEAVVVPLFGLMTFFSFVNLYQININLVREQPLAMARWLANNTPKDAVIAVHDVGMMRYIGGRKTLDIVGLTTPASAQYWRNGVGSVAEFLVQQQPDYIASYGQGHGYGLAMLADTRLYDNVLAEFPVDLDIRTNVALAAKSQAIYQPHWDAIQSDLERADVLAGVNVANIDSENAAGYQWSLDAPVDGFATLVYDIDLLGCDTSHSQLCKYLDAGRQLTGAEHFTFSFANTNVESDFLLISRVHPVNASTIDIYLNDILLDTQWIPQNPGNWLDIVTRIPQEQVSDNMTFRIVPQLDNGETYIPARHTLIQSDSNNDIAPETLLTSYQDNHIQLAEFNLVQTDTTLDLQLAWYSDGQAIGDYRFFAHLYSDINQQPVTQWDNYLGEQTLPIGNWLEGRRQDTIRLSIDGISSGTYTLMIGFYESQTSDRLVPTSYNDNMIILEDSRLILQDVEIK